MQVVRFLRDGRRCVCLLVGLAAAIAGCSSAPAPERSAHADGPPEGARSGDGEAALPAGEAPAEPAAEDVPEARFEIVQQRLGCTLEGPPKIGSSGGACGLLHRFATGRTPAFQAGTFPGVVLAPSASARDVAKPALLAVRGAGATTEVAWAALSPDDPRQATELTAMAADVLEGHAPSRAPAPGPGLVWVRPGATRGASASLGADPPIFARTEGDATIVLVWNEEAPLVAVHRAPASVP